MRCLPFIGMCALLLLTSFTGTSKSLFDTTIKPAAAAPANYILLLKGKNVGLIINQTSCVGDSSLLDILLVRGIKVVKIFTPEHGFRGKADAGAHVDNTIDEATHLPVVSLYGSHKKPTPDDLKDIDILVYDLQDVGVRFYTYISTLEYAMEACAEQQKQLVVLDRPNPNGFYIDGPVLKKENRSFVGMQAIPIVYAMTAGEYAKMLVGEHLFPGAATLDLQVVKCLNYDHSKKYELPIAPSPNLRNMAAIYAYPSLCLFEGTKISVGRGTAFPFQQFGSPELADKYPYTFTPQSGEGAKSPTYEGKKCFGVLVGETPGEILKQVNGRLQLKWLIDAYTAYPAKDQFFTDFFKKLTGSDDLKTQIQKGETEATIRKCWQKDLKIFKTTRKKYLLYKDF
ncbi:exo-beta-N-acetylmuramidase NamZ family protein [Flavipsychrobacter stenotrophus]|nr:DUF1343 domain-containing protein [Flavipsychrobacter stenotrophus]